MDWAADHVERRPTASLVPSARNARLHSEAHVREIAAAIREWGWTIPVLVDEAGEIIAGHGRVLAAHRLRLESVPVMVARGWTSEQKLAYSIADNRLTEKGEWDKALLKIDLSELRAANFDATLTGYVAAEIEAMLAPPPEVAPNADPDAAVAVEEVVVTKRGDVWLLGQHRLGCGDATSARDVRAVLGGMKPNLMVTDPPYGVGYDPSWSDGGIHGVRENKKVGKVTNDDRSAWGDAWKLFPGDVAYVWHADKGASTVERDLLACGFLIRAQIIWAKNRPILSRAGYHWQHEPCWYAVKKDAIGHWCGDRKQTTLWQIDVQNAETSHGTQKPVECMKRPIENNSAAGDAVYDPFVGSGTTIIAAEMTGRACYALEIDPAYVDVAVRRWQKYTGQMARLQGDNRTFEEVAAGRLESPPVGAVA
jgi:DNA modification methylase